jgi:hypothetical protein
VRCPFRYAQEGKFSVKLFFKKVALKGDDLLINIITFSSLGGLIAKNSGILF